MTSKIFLGVGRTGIAAAIRSSYDSRHEVLAIFVTDVESRVSYPTFALLAGSR